LGWERHAVAKDKEAPIAAIALRQVRADRDDNLMNRLVPYLDLFARLSDEELARLTEVPPNVAANLRQQVVQVDLALERFADLLPRLSDAELVRLTGATPKTIRFWRLCQPRTLTATSDLSVGRAAEKLGHAGHAGTDDEPPDPEAERPLESGAPLHRAHGSGEQARVATSVRRHPSGETEGLGQHPTTEMPRAAMVAEARRHPSDEMLGLGSVLGETGEIPRVKPPKRHPSGERSTYRMPTAEREGGPAFRQPAAVDLSAPQGPNSGSEEARFAETAAAIAARTRGQEPGGAPEVAQKHRVASEHMGVKGTPFPGYDAEASGLHGDGIFIGLEIPEG